MSKATEKVTDLMAALEASLRPPCQWPECCGDPDEDDFCGGCSRRAFEARTEGAITGLPVRRSRPPRTR
jgi:hypothetical protein